MGVVHSIRFRLPLPPSTNALYNTVRVGGRSATGTRRVSTKTARGFRKAALTALDVVDGSPENEATLDVARGAYWGLAIAAYFPTPHRRDLDDVLKIAIDVICAGLRLADNRLVDLHASKYLAPLQPCIDVELEAFADWSFGDERDVLPLDDPERRDGASGT